jgi:Protein of unknown function (DUF3667)
MTIKECPTCRKPGEGEYCSHCGEDLHPDRITIRYVLVQFMEIFTGFESNRLLHTFREMALRPGTTIRRYLRGTRQAFYNPVDYALLMGGLSILLSLFFNESIIGKRKVEAIAASDAPDFMAYVLEDPGTLMNLALLLQFPVAGLFTWLRRIRGRDTLGEHIYANAFLSGQVLAYNLIIVGLQQIFPGNGFMLFLSAAYGWFVVWYVSFAYYRWRHGNLRFPGLIPSILFMAMVYVTALLMGFMLALGYLYLVFRWKTGS